MPKMTEAERLILINQYTILDNIDGKHGASDLIITALERGYDEDFEDLVGYSHERISKETCDLVRDILWIYYIMKISRNKASIEANTIPIDENGMRKFSDVEPIFPGFDGNDGTGRYGYADYIINQRKQHPEHRHYLNSHGAEPDYDTMRAIWISWGKPSELTDDQVDRLLKPSGDELY